ncbi:phosphoenolpyruvate-protein phosphotransferase [Alicyclobacillus hesperidum subsp. aegles]|uniref:phosphoenolpyruvate--protein phosphotransferase n=1 Tax=Alicyclobacillus hesperidum TaxID=89784 RepID=UPI00222C006D|nr:phosphoenolpyruvate--protein phosphotransferase [Alicyclobacillus hesperidum]GLG00174.1 phosphoenolpyruvate-protein phosphotransferase [Alicyclobacillus hesperidum subsp. aegles]
MGTRFTGIAASDGVAIAPAFVLSTSVQAVEERRGVPIGPEIERLEVALRAAKGELESLRETADAKLGAEHAQIFTAHIQILEDPEFAGAIRGVIEGEQVNAEFALDQVAKQLIALFEQMDNEYMRQRAADIKDVSQRLLTKLQGSSQSSLADIQEPVVLVANDLAPSDTIQLDASLVRAFVTDIGGRTSHSAIMARSLGIPAVVGLGEITANVQAGQLIAVDGAAGLVVVEPDPEEQASFSSRAAGEAEAKARLLALKDEPSQTLDGRRVELAGNIGTPADVAAVLDNGGEGVGLFRSEFLYMNRQDAPSEEEQFAAYREVAERMGGKPVIVRTLDVGGDKEIPYLDLPKEANPFLGYRAIRVCLDRTELFDTQLRAILRASHYGKLRIMFPMISTVTEIRQAKARVEAVKAELRAAGTPFDENIEIGIMIEIPAAAVAADLLAKEVDFFSIGTNDLVQYTMACDRMNERISHLYQPLHPSVLRLIKMVIDGAHRHGKWVGMCGELAGELSAVPVLLGLGLDEFSMSAGSILKVRERIRGLRMDEAQTLAAEVLELDSQEDVLKKVQIWA